MVAKRDKMPKYEPLEDVLSAETAFLQASCALDIAALLAVESRDMQQLAAIAQQYIELGSRLMSSHESEDEEEEHDLSSESGFGFVPHEVPEKEVAHGGTDGKRRGQGRKARSQGWSISRIHPEHGEL